MAKKNFKKWQRRTLRNGKSCFSVMATLQITILSLKSFGNRLEKFADGEMLRTNLLALATLDALRSLAAFPTCEDGVVVECRVPVVEGVVLVLSR